MHLAPFLHAISKVSKSRFILNSDYWGQPGHSRSVPLLASSHWLRAVFLSQTTEVDDILESYHKLKQLPGPSEVLRSKALRKTESPLVEDEVNMANLLRDYHLK